LDVIRAEGRFDVAGILDRAERVGADVLGVPVIGTDEDMPALVAKSMCFLIALGQIKSPEPRIRLHTRLRELGVRVIHDERESAVAMVRAAMTSYERFDIDPEEIVGETMEQG
jgi:hypothetical protein